MNVRKKLWNILSDLYPMYLRKVYSMRLGEGVRVSYKAHLDKSINPQGVHIVHIHGYWLVRMYWLMIIAVL